MGGKYKHVRVCAICDKPKGFTRRIGTLTVCNAGPCVAEAARRAEEDAPPPKQQ